MEASVCTMGPFLTVLSCFFYMGWCPCLEAKVRDNKPLDPRKNDQCLVCFMSIRIPACFVLIIKSKTNLKKLRSSFWKSKLVRVYIIFGNSFCFLFSKNCFWEYKEKTIFLYFWNQKHIWLVKIKKIVFWRKK